MQNLTQSPASRSTALQMCTEAQPGFLHRGCCRSASHRWAHPLLLCREVRGGKPKPRQGWAGTERRGVSTQEPGCQRSCHRSCHIDLLVPWKKGMGEDVAFSLSHWWPSQGAKISWTEEKGTAVLCFPSSPDFLFYHVSVQLHSQRSTGFIYARHRQKHSRVNTARLHRPQGPLSAPTLALCPSSLDGQALSQYEAFVTHKIECKSFYIYYHI